jgi:hypothetical protein
MQMGKSEYRAALTTIVCSTMSTDWAAITSESLLRYSTIHVFAGGSQLHASRQQEPQGILKILRSTKSGTINHFECGGAGKC